MSIFESIISNFSSPVILCFLLGFIAQVLKSDLKLPEQLYQSISIYLLLAIGLKGGVQLSEFGLGELSNPLLATLSASVLTTICAFLAAYFIGRLSLADCSALAAHFGSASAVTFMTALSFLDEAKIDYPGYMTALFAIMEIPAVLLAIGFFSLCRGGKFSKALHEVFCGKTTLLLAGGLLIGALGGKQHASIIMPLFQEMFYGVLTFFLLEMGLLVGEKIGDVRRVGRFLPLFSILIPIINGALGVYLGVFFGMDLGGSTILGVMASSASYIAAPAAVRASIPEANPGFYITSSLVIAFPFNITLGIPLYFWFAEFLLGAY